MIKCIYYEVNRLLVILFDNFDDFFVLLIVLIGVVVFNINGLIIYSVFGIFKILLVDYVIFSEDKINSLRLKLENF